MPPKSRPVGECNQLRNGKRDCSNPAAPNRKRCSHHLEQSARYRRNERNRRREELYEYYGSICSCCGESNPKFLTLDHQNNDGHVYRNESSSASEFVRIYRERPTDITLLCYNCNIGKWRNGSICPHLD